LKYQAVIFDLYGTLVQTFRRTDYERALEEMVAILKAPHDEFIKMWYKTAGERAIGGFGTLEENIEYICKKIKISPNKTQLKRATKVRLDMVASALTPKEGAVETVKRLKSDGYKIGLISNCSPEPPKLWPGTPFAPYFDVTVFSSTIGLRKPDPRIYEMVAKKLSVKTETCLYIGDGDSDELEGAANVGMHPVLVINPGENSTNTIQDKPREKAWHGPAITSIREVLDLLGR
jgi:putative hydrolase of the HAD superfamily